jgi:carboxypeptidase Taq
VPVSAPLTKELTVASAFALDGFNTDLKKPGEKTEDDGRYAFTIGDLPLLYHMWAISWQIGTGIKFNDSLRFGKVHMTVYTEYSSNISTRGKMEQKLTELKKRLQEVEDLNYALSLLGWDQATYMPPGGAPARGRQMALLGRLSHEKFIDPAIGHLLDDLQPYGESLPYDDDDAALIRVTRRAYDKATRVPAQLLGEFQEHGAMSYQAWTTARRADDFATMRPMLEKTLDFSRRLADCFPGYDHIADPLIDFADDGMKAESIRDLFAGLRTELVPLLRDVLGQPPADDSCLHQHFPEDKQREFGEMVIKQLGYDFNRGRLDKTFHPFMTKFSLGDVRITTRYQPDYLGDSLFSTIHEAGHAIYEQGIDMAYETSPLGGGTSAGVHESQSRLWENVVGRSLPFWQHYYPQPPGDLPGSARPGDIG